MRPIHRSVLVRALHVLGIVVFALSLAACSGSRTASQCCAQDPCTPPCEPVSSRPPEAKAGETWCKVWDPPVYKTLVEKVCVCPAKTRKVYVPPEYGTRLKVVCVAPANLKEVTRPGQWDTRQKEVLACPETEAWRRICCDEGGNPCEVRGDCWQMQKVPAKFRTECERVCIAPPKTCVEFRPAQYKCVEESVLIKEGFCEEYQIPAKFTCRTRRVCVRPGCWKWVRRADCDVPEEALPALEVEMTDMAADGGDQGVFKVGELVRYELSVKSDEGSMSMPDLRVVFDLPEHLEFVEGGGVEMTQDGRTATTVVFPLGVGESQSVHVIAKVMSTSPSTLVKFSASVQMKDGTELATETESTSLEAAALAVEADPQG